MRTTLSYATGIFSALLFMSGLGCSDGNDEETVSDSSEPDGEGGSNAARIQTTCQNFCDKAQVCDDDETVEQCVADCKAQLGDCMADEQSQVLDELNSCAAMSCDDMGGCTFGAGLQCKFGI